MVEYRTNGTATASCCLLILITQLPLYRPATKKDGQWLCTASQHKLMGPHNPSTNKSALMAVTRGGTIRLLMQGQDSSWQEIKAEIDSISTVSELLTHAAMCADKGLYCWQNT